MSLSTFQLAEWIETRNPSSKYNFAGSACPGRSLKDLVDLSTEPETTAANLDFSNLKLNYNSANSGQSSLKSGIASLFSTPLDAKDIVSTIGTSIANHVVLQTLLRSGDHVICVQPTYAQLHDIPRMLGAEVTTWRHHFPDEWRLQFGELEAMIRDNTKLIIVNNPNNPTGTYLDDGLQRQILELAKKHQITVLADEIFRPLFHFSSTSGNASAPNGHSGDGLPKSFLDHAHDLNYIKVIVTGSLSKCWSFPGLRLGWMICRSEEIISACMNLRLYMVNSVSPIDELIASEALSSRCQQQINAENLATARKGLDLLEQFVIRSEQTSQTKYKAQWVKPLASSTTLIRFIHKSSGKVVDDIKLCHALFEQAQLLLVPASLCFDMNDADAPAEAAQGWMRIGFVSGEARMTESLDRLEKFLEAYEEK